MANEHSCLWKQFVHDEVGGPAVEYALVAALIAMTIITGLLVMNERIQQTYTTIATSL